RLPGVIRPVQTALAGTATTASTAATTATSDARAAGRPGTRRCVGAFSVRLSTATVARRFDCCVENAWVLPIDIDSDAAEGTGGNFSAESGPTVAPGGLFSKYATPAN